MKSFIKIITVFVAISLATGGFALAQEAAEKKSQKAVKEMKVAAQKAAEAAQEATEAALDEARKKARAALNKVKLDASDAYLRLTKPLAQRGNGSVLAIPTTEMKAEQIATIMEDMTVMSRIFDKELQQAHLLPERGSFWYRVDVLNRFFERHGQTTEAIYLEDYAALFLIEVDFPLAPPELQQPEPAKADTDIIWEQTKREIYAPEELSKDSSSTPAEKYDPEKVENLKQVLIETLKHAANIRTLKPDERVIVTVTGLARQHSGVFEFEFLQSSKDPFTADSYQSEAGGSGFSFGGGTGGGVVLHGGGPGERSPASHAVLTIRAKKSDIDEYAKEKLDFEQFQKQVKILMY